MLYILTLFRSHQFNIRFVLSRICSSTMDRLIQCLFIEIYKYNGRLCEVDEYFMAYFSLIMGTVEIHGDCCPYILT